MKRSLLWTLVFFAGIALQAQESGSKLSDSQKQQLKESMEAYKARLNLTEAQQQQVEQINMTFLTQLSKIKEGGGGKLAQYKKFKEATNKKDKEMKGVLNASQYQIYLAQKEEFKKKLKKQRKN